MKFIDKVTNGSAVIGIIGLGYVGIPLGLSIVRSGLSVIGFDISQSRIDELNSGKSPIAHFSDQEIKDALQNDLQVTTDFSRTVECDGLLICVPTPLKKSREPDLSFITATMDAISAYLREEQFLALESTTWPGTTDEVLLPYIEEKGLLVGHNFYLAYSPEREDPGNTNFHTQTIPKIIGGHTQNCLDAGMALYKMFIDQVVPVSSTKAAELVKLLENIHRSVNIGLANEMKMIADRMGLDIFEITDAAATKPFGFTAYYPGPGIGGHCIPIDPFYLTWKAKEFGFHTRFIELAGEINAAMPEYVVGKLSKALNERYKSLKGSKILVLGIAYKKNIDDMRESPSVMVMELLRDAGAEISYHDPHVPIFPKMRDHSFDLSSVAVTPESLRSYDAVVLTTDHTNIDYDMIAAHAPLILDSRGVYRDPADNIVKA